MELKLIRRKKTSKSTVGDLYIDGTQECLVLEDPDRGLTSDMTEEEIGKIKVNGNTAIPTGRYEITFSFSNRFKQLLPLLLNVKGYDGIRMHSGNKPADTHGCLLPGETDTGDFVTNSRVTYKRIEAKMLQAIKKEKIFITIQ